MMNKEVEELIEWVAEQIHQIQVESAKLNDSHTEGINVLYLEWGELHQDMKDWYIFKAKQILSHPSHPGLALIDRNKLSDSWTPPSELNTFNDCLGKNLIIPLSKEIENG
jgi:hypothetical protein